jgi:hypothetical protein
MNKFVNLFINGKSTVLFAIYFDGEYKLKNIDDESNTYNLHIPKN